MKKSTYSRPTIMSQGTSTSVSDKKIYTEKKLFIIKYKIIDFEPKTKNIKISTCFTAAEIG